MHDSDRTSPIRFSLPGVMDGDRSPPHPQAAPPEPPPAPPQPEPTRAIARQATSAVAFVMAAPEPDDPLLAFEPYVHAAPRKRSITPDVQRAFIAQLAATGIVKQAARHVGRSLEALYKLRHRPGAEGFSAAWDAAVERGAHRLEEVAMQRALVGTRTPIVSQGKILGHWDKPDNALLRFLLRHRLADRYTDPAARASFDELVPGHPVYDRIAKEGFAAETKRRMGYDHEDKVLASIDAKLERMRQRLIASGRLEDHSAPREGPEEAD